MRLFSFPKKERLLNRKDFVNLNRIGKRYNARHFIVILLENRLGVTRLGITVSKKTGNAVKRNKVKRLIREFYRLHKGDFPQGYDIVVIAKRNAHGLSYWKVEEELGEICFDKRLSRES